MQSSNHIICGFFLQSLSLMSEKLDGNSKDNVVSKIHNFHSFWDFYPTNNFVPTHCLTDSVNRTFQFPPSFFDGWGSETREADSVRSSDESWEQKGDNAPIRSSSGGEKQLADDSHWVELRRQITRDRACTQGTTRNPLSLGLPFKPVTNTINVPEVCFIRQIRRQITRDWTCTGNTGHHQKSSLQPGHQNLVSPLTQYLIQLTSPTYA